MIPLTGIPWSFKDKLGTERTVVSKFVSVRIVRSDSGLPPSEKSLEEWLLFVEQHAAEPEIARQAREALDTLRELP